ncbi:hypothetical protein J6590_098884 [Homalodisca vitripennis]|nr:hypothetical protein J6590_098884 [Homalodisca vitripennis]
MRLSRSVHRPILVGGKGEREIVLYIVNTLLYSPDDPQHITTHQAICGQETESLHCDHSKGKNIAGPFRIENLQMFQRLLYKLHRTRAEEQRLNLPNVKRQFSEYFTKARCTPTVFVTSRSLAKMTIFTISTFVYGLKRERYPLMSSVQATFRSNGVVNDNILHYWSFENPHSTRAVNNQ